MRNLAGDPQATEICTSELTRCRIPIVPADNVGEAPTTVMGRFGDKYTFRRAWYYWVVTGKVPLAVAQQLYAHPVAKAIRVAGHCGCPAPEDPWLVYYDGTGRQVLDIKEQAQFEKLAADGSSETAQRVGKEGLVEYRFEADRTPFAAYVENYHIDSELGLYVFVEHLKAAGLCD